MKDVEKIFGRSLVRPVFLSHSRGEIAPLGVERSGTHNDTVHEMARDEARHGKALKGLLERYFG